MTDVIIVGGGLAGLYTALQINNDLNITIISKTPIQDTNSYLAQGGIAAELELDQEDLLSHIQDTLHAGSWVNDTDALEVLVKDAKENIEHLIEYGVNFDKLESGHLNVTLEGGHSKRRILHAGGDATGKVMMNALHKQILEAKNITIIDHAEVSNLIVKDDTCYGVVYFDQEDNQNNLFAPNTILATGGLGAIYQHTTNPEFATGDSVGIAYRSGVKLADLEFIQFHPTALYLQENRHQNFLISEAVRGEGGYLRNNLGERFMSRYHKRAELAPRDIVSTSIVKEMYNTWHDCVYLDATHLDKDFLDKRFPTITEMCRKNGFEMSKDQIPVIPVQHYTIGGVWTNKDGETSVKQLYANGECAATGVHGANRLASNSLLECVVFGNRIAKLIHKTTCEQINIETKEIGNTKITYSAILDDIRTLMEQHVGVVRTMNGLKIAQSLVERHYANLISNPNNTKHYFRALNMVTSAKCIIEAAVNRPKSMGCHTIVEDTL